MQAGFAPDPARVATVAQGYPASALPASHHHSLETPQYTKQSFSIRKISTKGQEFQSLN